MNERSLRVLEFDKIRGMLADYAGTPAGKSRCLALLPYTEADAIRQAQKETTDAVARLFAKGSLSFSGTYDLTASCKRLEVGASLSAAELLTVAKVLNAAARAKAYGERDLPEEEWDSLDPLFAGLVPMVTVCREIDRCILSEEEIADDASPGLRRVRRSMTRVQEQIRSHLHEIVNRQRTLLQDAVITMRDGRYCIPVKLEHRSEVPGLVHDTSSSGSTVFVEPAAVVKFNNDLRELEIEEKKEIEAVLASLSSLCAEHTDDLQENVRILTELDFIFAKGRFSRALSGSAPVYDGGRVILIKKGRHPLLPKDTVVPMDLTFGDPERQLIITGPNTGGKTVTLKTVGLFCLMGQAGLHLPAWEGSRLPVFTDVFADIGDEQSIEQSLSTFSSHMVNIVSILDTCDPSSLVLFDELGAGTDPTEGAALAVSILSFLKRMDVCTMATTHYSELKEYALTTPGVENASCEFDVATLRPTYRLLIGIPGKSNAFAISKRLGLPDFLIDDAKARLNSEDVRFEDLVAGLEDERKQLMDDRESAKEARRKAEAFRSQYESLIAKFEKRKEKMLADASEEARKVLQDAKDYADDTIRRINKQASGGVNMRELENERALLREALSDLPAPELAKAPEKKPAKKGEKQKPLAVGDTVFVNTLGLKGTVTSLPNARGQLTVQMGMLSSTVNIKDIAPAEEDMPEEPVRKTASQASTIGMGKAAAVSPEINLIGMTVDEALPELEKYLDDAYLAHLPSVRVVHGRGTGALRKAVQQKLRKLSYVKSYRGGEYGEGDSGVTIVTFK